jgi:hypothetical protein
MSNSSSDTSRRTTNASLPPRRNSIPVRAVRSFRAVAVLAIALASLGISAQGAGASTAAATRTAPAHFSLTRPYAWLPGLAYSTARSTNVYLTRIYESVFYVPASGPVVRFNAFPAGDCHVHAGKLDCKPAQFIGFLGTSPRLGRRVGTIDGAPAYWAKDGGLSWQYAPRAWANLHIQNTTSPAPSLQLARTARFGTKAAPPVLYQVQLRSVPVSWQVSYVRARIAGRRLLARTANVTPGPANGVYGTDVKTTPEFDMLDTFRFKGVTRYSCPVGGPPGPEKTTTQTIRGIKVQLSWYLNGVPHIVCAPQARGQHFALTAGENEKISALTLFRNARLLGPNPARWTTRLLG